MPLPYVCARCWPQLAKASKGAWRRRCRRCDGLDRLARSTRDRRQACVARVPTAGEHSEHRRNPLRGGGRAYETEVRLLKPRRRGWDRRALRAGCRVVDRAVPSRQLNPRNRTHRPAGVASALGQQRTLAVHTGSVESAGQSPRPI